MLKAHGQSAFVLAAQPELRGLIPANVAGVRMPCNHMERSIRQAENSFQAIRQVMPCAIS